MSKLSEDGLWDYAAKRYALCREACLVLQDKFQVNVNLLLLLCWCVEHGAVVTLADLTRLRDVIADSDLALKQHRITRQQAKPPAGDAAAYEALKKQELALEAEQQRILVNTYNQLARPVADGAVSYASVAAFMALYNLRADDVAKALLTKIVTIKSIK